MHSFNSSSIETGLDSLSSQDSETHSRFSEFRREKYFENNQQVVAPSYSTHGPSAIPSVLNKNQKKKYTRWDVRFEELVDFKKINGHTNVPQQSGFLGRWVHTQRTQHRKLNEGKYSPLTTDRREKLESIGFVFLLFPHTTYLRWEQHFQEIVNFKKINGHMLVRKRSGDLGKWVSSQRTHYRFLKEGKSSSLTIDRCEKLESIGFTFKCQPNRKRSNK
eukprot:scaffold4428_cov43-Attheya_sp.AAC.1